MDRTRRIACLVLLAAVLAAVLAGRASGESPYRLGWSKDGRIAGASAVAGVGAALAGRTPEPLTVPEINELSRGSINPFDRSATWRYSDRIGEASDVLLGAVVAAPLALMLDARVREDWETCTLMYAETMALAVILPAFGKGTVDRIRPFVYNPDAPMDRKTTSDARKSFFSRHTSVAFASAVFVSTVYGDYHPGSAAGRCLWAGSILAAAAVGAMRYESGKHFPTDIVAGAAAGSAVGYIIPRIHRIGGERLSLRPDFRGSRPGLALELRI
ncbi:MAG: phosphatase PAP2 family protein [Candidatus Krumholzibacteria bacterium]|nr:phosphatase PAP2 family protein [Candidatus Krumholzibacteria bacterium]